MKVKLTRNRLIAIFLICGTVYCPLTLVYAVQNPERAIYLTARMGKGVYFIKKDINSFTSNMYKKFIPEPVRKKVTRYELGTGLSFSREVVGFKKPGLLTQALGKIKRIFI